MLKSHCAGLAEAAEAEAMQVEMPPHIREKGERGVATPIQRMGCLLAALAVAFLRGRSGVPPGAGLVLRSPARKGKEDAGLGYPGAVVSPCVHQ